MLNDIYILYYPRDLLLFLGNIEGKSNQLFQTHRWVPPPIMTIPDEVDIIVAGGKIGVVEGRT